LFQLFSSIRVYILFSYKSRCCCTTSLYTKISTYLEPDRIHSSLCPGYYLNYTQFISLNFCGRWELVSVSHIYRYISKVSSLQFCKFTICRMFFYYTSRGTLHPIFNYICLFCKIFYISFCVDNAIYRCNKSKRIIIFIYIEIITSLCINTHSIWFYKSVYWVIYRFFIYSFSTKSNKFIQ